jgi:hypothetical protein
VHPFFVIAQSVGKFIGTGTGTDPGIAPAPESAPIPLE